MKLVLASRSESRRRMLESAGINFEAHSAPLDEEAAKAELRAAGADARTLAMGLAEAKALSLAVGPDELVLGADQTLERADGSMIDKPGSRGEALAQLRSLSGSAHRLHAAAAIAEKGSIVWRSIAAATMHVRPLGDDFLRAYLDSEYEAVRHGVGGYHIEGRGVQLFRRIQGCQFVIRGLPLLPLLDYLRTRGLLTS